MFGTWLLAACSAPGNDAAPPPSGQRLPGANRSCNPTIPCAERRGRPEPRPGTAADARDPRAPSAPSMKPFCGAGGCATREQETVCGSPGHEKRDAPPPCLSCDGVERESLREAVAECLMRLAPGSQQLAPPDPPSRDCTCRRTSSGRGRQEGWRRTPRGGCGS